MTPGPVGGIARAKPQGVAKEFSQSCDDADRQRVGAKTAEKWPGDCSAAFISDICKQIDDAHGEDKGEGR